MRILSFITVAFTGVFISFTAQSQVLTVTSPAFAANSLIPSKYSCEGQEVSPPLNITRIPANTRQIAIIAHDPDADKAGGMTHWVAWNIPLNGTITENDKSITQGLNGANTPGWKGMCPPTGIHHYHFKAYALDTALDLPANTDKAALEKAMEGHILGWGELVGLYQKIK